MNRIILIKYGELTTKKGNRKFFINTLYNNIKKKLANLEVKISKDFSRMYIEFMDQELAKVLENINQVFGIHTYQVAYKIETKESEIKEVILNIIKEKSGTFKVETKRSDKKFPTPSLEFSKNIGGFILHHNQNLKVDVHQPDYLINIEILERYTYIYTNSQKGLGGYPVGVQGLGLLMLSGGIDSPVAGYLTLKRGVKLDAVYFEALPHTSLEARSKVIELTRKLCNYQDKIKLHLVPFTLIQEEIYKNCNSDYTITIMRRMMYRIMEGLAKKHKALIISNGESIGQVASQTLTSMKVINEVTNFPIIRPVGCLDKLEIIEIAKKIDTYSISILPFEDCCTVFVPKHPVINPNLAECLKNEALFPYLELIDIALEKTETIVITKENEDFKEFL